ncbi:MAG: DegT/DnrJ/EryC1/StrS family aminotransferase [Candidatus Brocadiia bacterium]
MNNVPFVDLGAQYKQIREEVIKKIDDINSRGDFILGEDLKMFEQEFSAFCGVQYGVGVASGTDALYLALMACGVKAGDEVITAPNSFIATAVAISLTGAKPVFVDVDPVTYNINPKLIKAKITSKTKAIIPIHLYGQPAEMNGIMSIARAHKLFVIEDAAQAHGVMYKGQRVGGFGDLACFSFYPAKNLGAYGDGGMVVSNNQALSDKVRMLRNYGQKVKNQHSTFGVNSRLDNLQAAILRVKLKYIDRWNDNRRKNAKLFQKCFLSGSAIDRNKVVLPNPAGEQQDHIYHIYAILIENRDKLGEYLKSKGISFGMHYPIPIHLQECYGYLGYKKGDFPAAENMAAKTISLPMYPEMELEQIERVVAAVKDFSRA